MTTRAAPRRLAFLLGALAMFGPFAIDTVFPAFPNMARDFAATPFAVQQTITAYLVAYTFMSLFHGPLSDALGRRPIILCGVVAFGFASAGCALSQSLPQLLCFRAVQGLSAGAGLIVGRAIIRDCLEGDAAQRLMSSVTMIFSVAPAVAPIVGGWILGWSNWPMIFWFLLLLSGVLCATTWAWLPETHPRSARIPFRPRQVLSASLSLLNNHQFVRFAIAGGFNFGALFLFIASAPAFVMDTLGLQSDQFGWFFVPTIAGMALGALLSGQLAGRVRPATTARLGFLICGAAAVANVAYFALGESPKLPWAVLPAAVNAFGISMVFPILTITVLDMYPRNRGAAASMQTVLSLSFNTVVAGLVSPLVSHDPLWMASTAALFTTLAWLTWRWAMRHAARFPQSASSSEMIAAEPSDRL